MIDTTSTYIEVKDKMKITRELSVGQVSARSGVAVSALHFYERKGLIASRRSHGNQRRYQLSVLRRISIIKFAQELGISLLEIGVAFESLPNNTITTTADWQVLARNWGGELDARIQRLQKLRNSFSSCIGCGCLSIDQCKTINQGDHLAAGGQGPRKLLGD